MRLRTRSVGDATPSHKEEGPGWAAGPEQHLSLLRVRRRKNVVSGAVSARPLHLGVMGDGPAKACGTELVLRA
jgi:hypothetical protein